LTRLGYHFRGGARDGSARKCTPTKSPFRQTQATGTIKLSDTNISLNCGGNSVVADSFSLAPVGLTSRMMQLMIDWFSLKIIFPSFRVRCRRFLLLSESWVIRISRPIGHAPDQINERKILT